MGMTEILSRIWLLSVKIRQKALKLLVNNNSTHRRTQLIIAAHNRHIKYLPHRKGCTEYGKQLEAKI